MKVLIDTNIEINAITHKTVLVSKTIRWGRRDQKLQVAQRDHFPPREDETFRQIQLPWLASLCNLAKQGRLEFFTSPEIQMETLRQKGYDPGYLGLNLLRDVPVKSIPCPMQRSILISATGGIGVAKREQTRFSDQFSIRDFSKSEPRPETLTLVMPSTCGRLRKRGLTRF